MANILMTCLLPFGCCVGLLNLYGFDQITPVVRPSPEPEKDMSLPYPEQSLGQR